MNPFIFSFVALCLAQGAVAQYQQNGGAGSYGGQQQQQQQSAGYQRKMSPSPQSYGAQPTGGHYAAAPAPASAYQPQQQQQQYAAQSYGGAEMSAYEQPQPQQQQQPSYRAPSSAAQSSYEERSPAASSGYGKAAAAPAASYGRQQQQQQAASYQAPAYQPQQSYAKAAPKYEEPVHPPMPFAWGYDINDGYGGAQYHKESGDEYGKRTGSYGYTDAYGIYRQVDYVADEHGFRATIKTNEPGTANESPADVELHAYEPPSNYYAGSAQQSYGSGQKSAYAPAAPAQSYGRQASASSSYGGNQRASAYSSKQPAAAASGYSARPAAYEQQQQQQQQQSGGQYAAASLLAPVYQKAPLAAKKY